MSIATQEAAYATNSTPEKFWAHWEEKFLNDAAQTTYRTDLQRIKNQPLTPEQKDNLFSDRFRYVRTYFEALESEQVLPTIQDEYLYGLCRPERLMDVVFNFVLFDNGDKKVARYQQFFAIKKSMQRIVQLEGRRHRPSIRRTAAR